MIIHSHKSMLIESSVSNNLNLIFLSWWCFTCNAVSEPSCHDSHHIVLDRTKDLDELCNLLLVGATHSSDLVTLRERL